MRFKFFKIVMISMLGITPLCYAKTSTDKTSIKEVKKETQDLVQTLKTYSVDQKDEAIRKTKTALDNLDNRIDALEANVDKNWDKMDKKARKQARDSLKALRKQRNQVAQWYGSMKTSTGNAWEHMKKGFSKAYMTLNDAWEKSEKEFGSSK